MEELIYLASPYSHRHSSVKMERFHAVCKKAADLMRSGLFVFSPIAHTHPISLYDLPGDWEFWKEYDEIMLKKCDKMLVLMLEGWETSKGVQAEVEFMQAAGKQVEYITP